MNRVMRMGVGLLGLVPVLLLAGWLFGTLGAEGEGGAWMVFATGAVWIILMIWWALRAPAQISPEARPRYLAFLRHAQFQPLDETDSDATGKRE